MAGTPTSRTTIENQVNGSGPNLLLDPAQNGTLLGMAQA